MPQKTEDAVKKETGKGSAHFEQLKSNLSLDKEKVYEYKLMIEERFRRYGPTKSRITVKTRDNAASPLIAGIDPKNWDANFVIDGKLRFRDDPELLKYLDKRNVVDPVKELLRTVGDHEMGHWEFPRGTQFGCPYDKTTYYTSFIEPIHDELKKSGKGFSEGFCKSMAPRIANAAMDVIDNYNVANALGRMGEKPTGQMLFWYLQGQEAGKYDGEYTMFVRLNLALLGERDDAMLLRKFLQNSEGMNKSVANLEKIFTEKAMYSRERWETLAREYAKEAIKYLKGGETPGHQHSPDDRTALGRKSDEGSEGKRKSEEGKGENEEEETGDGDGGNEENGEEGGEGTGGGGGGNSGEEEGGEQAQGSKGGKEGEEGEEEEGNGDGEAGQEEKEGENSGAGGEGEEEEGEEKDGEGKGGEESEEEKDEEGSGGGKEEEEEGSEDGGEGEEEKSGEEGEEEAGSWEKEDENIGFGGKEAGSDLTPEEIERIMGGRVGGKGGGKGIGAKGVPYFIKTDEALDAYYRHLAKRIPLKVDGKLPSGTFPIIPETFERFDPEIHSAEDAVSSRLHFDPVSRSLSPSVVKTRMRIDIPIRKEKRELPDFVFSLIDSSGSMMGVGDRSIVSWGDESYYHYGMLTFWGLLRFFEMERILHKVDVSAAIFSSATLDTKGLKDVKRMLLGPASGGTHIDMGVVLNHLRGKQRAVFSFITDGGISNWTNIRNEFIEIAKRNQFFMIQIGTYRQTADDLINAGLKDSVFFVNSPKEVANLAIDLTVKRYRAIIEKSAEKDKKRLAKEFGK